MTVIFENLDLILIAAVIIIAALVFARRGQVDLLRELIVGLSGGIDTAELYERLPKLTRLLVSGKTVEKIVAEKEIN